VSRLLPPITVNGTTYRVLRLEGARGPRFLLRSAAGELIGLYARGAEPMRLYAAPLVPQSGAAGHPLARVDFLDVAGTLRLADALRRLRARLARAPDLARRFGWARSRKGSCPPGGASTELRISSLL
jgi:hypothetical protein